MKADRVIFNASQLLVVPEKDKDLLGPILNGAVALKEGMIVETGVSDEILKKHPGAERIDAGARLVMPGFVDSHTHLIHGGERTAEMEQRLAGKTYLEILKAGGGIHSTVMATRKSTQKELAISALNRLNHMAAHGTTTVEIKSGYGLEHETEKKMLYAAADLKEMTPIEIVTTYLGAHTLPKNKPRKDVMKDLLGSGLDEFLPLAKYFDVFCEEGAFTLEESRLLLTEAKKRGFLLKIHAGQFNPLGAAGMAATLGATSADHLEELAQGEAEAMAINHTVATMLPGVPFFLQGKNYPDGRKLIDTGVEVAIATDYNPGSCPSYSMPFMIALGVFQCGLSTEEAIRGATLTGAKALGLDSKLGSLEPGKQGDIIILNIEKPGELPYYFGTNPVSRVFKRGIEIG